MATLLIDNYDSFTYNLYQQLAVVRGEEPRVVRNDEVSLEDIRRMAPDSVVLSPGPGTPERPRDFGICRQVLTELEVPVLGVCLGHQGLGHVFGGSVVPAPRVMHGRLSPVEHAGDALFDGIPSGFQVVRYHSLALARPLSEELEEIAWADGGVIMALRHRRRPLWGIQFHPESICTEHGDRLIANFLRLAGLPRRRHAVSRPLATPPRETGAWRVHHRRLDRFPDPETVFLELFADRPQAFWLDSSRTGDDLARFSFMGCGDGPRAETVRYSVTTGVTEVTDADGRRHHRESILTYLQRQLRERTCASPELPFELNGGFVGYFGYELKAECGAADNPGRSPHADASLLFADRLLAFDHRQRQLYLVAVSKTGDPAPDRWLDDTAARLDRLQPQPLPAPPAPHRVLRFHLDRDRQRYLEDIHCCLDEIHRGESYEACLTNQLRTRVGADPVALYRSLRRLNPAPYAAYLDCGGHQVLCSSPERFLHIHRDGRVTTKPIKGTLAREADPAADRAARERLATSVKDRSENLMIVDLLRNDLGRVCAVGSVRVPKLMEVESYATVHQLVSTVTGQLRPDRDAVDCLRAAFPGGSMTGAPKLRTLEILDRLEGRARGVYSGTIGFFGLGGGADLNIVIRTAVVDGDELSIGVGGAIVALSDPDEEFEEILLKGQALMSAAAAAETGDPDRFAVATGPALTVTEATAVAPEPAA